jgi:hypothetical protein
MVRSKPMSVRALSIFFVVPLDTLEDALSDIVCRAPHEAWGCEPPHDPKEIAERARVFPLTDIVVDQHFEFPKSLIAEAAKRLFEPLGAVVNNSPNVTNGVCSGSACSGIGASTCSRVPRELSLCRFSAGLTPIQGLYSIRVPYNANLPQGEA